MAEFEEKLNAILSDPEAMGQILSAAKALTGDGQEGTASSPSEAVDDPFSAIRQLDPRIVKLGMGLLQEYSASDDKKTALLEALKPFLKPERQAKIDQAAKIARLSRVLRVGLDIFRTNREDDADV